MPTPKPPILILGAGIAGLTTALALKQKNIDFLLLEAVPEIKALGAGITLAGNAVKVLQKLGVADEIKRRGFPISIMTIANEKGKKISSMDATAFNKKHDIESVAIDRGLLHGALLENIPSQNIQTGKKGTEVEQDENGVTLKFENGTSIHGSALIAADGINSAIRLSFLPASTARYAGYTCWRGIARKNIIGTQAVEVWGPAGRFGYVPISKDKVYWFATKNARRMDQSMKAFTIADVANNYKDYADPVGEILATTPANELLWNDIVDLEPLDRYAFDRVVLIGDAAHATTPNMGQGAGLGIEDAAKMAEMIGAYPDDLPEAFRQFERVRIPRARYIVDSSYTLGQIAQVENYLIRKLRDTFLRLIPASSNEKQMKKVLNID